MKKLYYLIAFTAAVSCQKYDKRDYATAPLKSNLQYFILSDFIPSDLSKPKVTLEITDSTFSVPSNFSYSFLNGNNDTLPGPAFDEYYWTFAPGNKNLGNPAFLTYEYNSAVNLTSVKPYKIKLNVATEDIALTDTAKWILISNYQFNAATKVYVFPVSDFQHVYFMAKKP